MTDATIRTRASRIERLINQTAVPDPSSDPSWVHSDVYLSITEDGVDGIVSAGGGSIMTYTSFDAEYFDTIEGEAEVVLEADRVLERLKLVDAGDVVVELSQSGEGRLSQHVSIRDDTAGVDVEERLRTFWSPPASDTAFDHIPQDLPERWDDDDCFLSPSGSRHATFIDTEVETVQQIINTVEVTDGVDFFPVSVEDERFRIAVGNDVDGTHGDLPARQVTGKDLLNHYGPGFEPIFGNALSGDVRLQTTPERSMAIVAERNDRTLRHVIQKVNPA